MGGLRNLHLKRPDQAGLVWGMLPASSPLFSCGDWVGLFQQWMHPRGLTSLFLCLPATGDELFRFRCEVGTRRQLGGGAGGCEVTADCAEVVDPKISFQPLRLSHPEIQDPLLAG